MLKVRPALPLALFILPALFILFGITAMADNGPASTTAASPGAAAGLPGDPDKGGTLYATNCASCHGPNLQGGVGAKLNPIQGGKQNLDPNYLIDTITHGESGKFGLGQMPTKGGNDKLTDQDVKDLAAFIIKSNQEGGATLSPTDLARSTVFWVSAGIITLVLVTWLLARYNMRWIARRAKNR